MRITRVVLKNIKSYTEQRIPFDLGTIAIRGHNGAGKSTLVEAIGYALFDALPYKQANFVREGEKSGSVMVAFVSADDGREYEVTRTCGRSSEWYVYDSELGVRPAEQHKDVEDFLRRHLGVEGSISLKDLFTSAIGVPQGAITADFLMKDADRKRRFNALLQVEDYNKAWENLRETNTYLEGQIKEQEHTLGGITEKTEQLPRLREERDQLAVIAKGLRQRLTALDAESQRVTAQVIALTQREQEVQKARSAAELAQSRLAMAQQQATQAAEILRGAKEAVTECARALPHHQEYLDTAKRLAAAQKQAVQRDKLRLALGEAQRRLERAKSGEEHAHVKVAEADQAAHDAAKLEGPVAQQDAFERQRDAVRGEIERLAGSEQQRARQAKAFESNLRQIETTHTAIMERERLLPLAAELATRRDRWDAIRTAGQMHAEHVKRRAHLGAAIAEEERKHARHSQAEATFQKNLATLERDYAGAPDALAAVEGEIGTVSEGIRGVEVKIAHARQSREQSGMGNCPFLHEPCLNIKQRGENSLATYFDGQIAAHERELAPLAARLDELKGKQKTLIERVGLYNRKGEFAGKLEMASAQRADCDARLASLTAERDELTAKIAAHPDAAAHNAARTRFEEAEKAGLATAQLSTLREGLAREEARSRELSEQLEALDRDLARLPAAKSELTQHETMLAQLGDPRTRRATLAHIAQEQPARAQGLRQAIEASALSERECATHEKALAPFANLDESIASLNAASARTEAGHQTYLRHETLASQHEKHQRAHQMATKDERAAAQAYASAEREAQRAVASFDPAVLDGARKRDKDINSERGSVEESLKHTQMRGEEYARVIAEVEALLGHQHAALEELRTLKEMRDELGTLREKIRSAGPGILSAIMRAISAQANRYFGEIIGDRSAHLAWENDFEITLTRDGVSRSFAQLSGGEQMSAALAVRLALLRELSRLDIAFFDEPTQNMDGARRENLASQMQRVQGFQQLIVISHDDTFEQGLDSVISLEKRHGKTVLRGSGLDAEPDWATVVG